MTHYNPQQNAFYQDPPQDDPNGLWGCVDDKNQNHGSFSFLEVYRERSWSHKHPWDRRVCVRISNFIDNSRREIKLGECVMLEEEELFELHAHIGRMLEEMK